MLMSSVGWIVSLLGILSLGMLPGRVWAEEEPQPEPLWPDDVTAGEPLHSQEELMVNHEHTRNKFGLNRSHAYVSAPTLSWHFPPADVKTDVAVIVCPGGGYNEIWIDWEGHDIARRLTQQGLTVAVLKYRTRPQTMDWPAFLPEVIQDAARAVRVVRSRAAEFGFDANKVGMLGFSAGGHLIASLCVWGHERPNRTGDPVEALSARPDFVALMYPGLDGGIPESVTADFPPAFIMHASNDDLVPVSGSLQLYGILLKYAVPAELHIFTTGGHGFALGRTTGGAVTEWPDLFIKWLGDIKMLEC